MPHHHDVIRSTACFRLRVHTLHFETATLNQSNSPSCDLCNADNIRIRGEQHFSTVSIPM